MILESQTRSLEKYHNLGPDGTLQEAGGITEYAGRVVNQSTAKFLIRQYTGRAASVTQIQLSEFISRLIHHPRNGRGTSMCCHKSG